MKRILTISLILATASVSQAEIDTHAQAAGIFDAAAVAGSVQTPVMAGNLGAANIAALPALQPKTAVVPAVKASPAPAAQAGFSMPNQRVIGVVMIGGGLGILFFPPLSWAGAALIIVGLLLAV